MLDKQAQNEQRVKQAQAVLATAKEKTGWPWLRIANFFGVEPSIVYRWRDGSRRMEPDKVSRLRWLIATEAPVEGKPDAEQYRAILDAIGDMIGAAVDDGRLVEALDRRGLDASQIPGCAAVVDSCLSVLRDALHGAKE